VVDISAGATRRGVLFRIDVSGMRTIVSDFANYPAQGPIGAEPWAVVMDNSGQILVLDGDTGSDPGLCRSGVLFRVDSVSGNRAVMSNFCDPAQGAAVSVPSGVAVETTGYVLVCDGRQVVRIHPSTGYRTVLSNLSDPGQGPTGVASYDVSVEPGGTILVATSYGGTDSKGAVFRVDPINGSRTLLSDFGAPVQGDVGVPLGMKVKPTGQILAILTPGGTSTGYLIEVDATTGKRTVISDFTDLSEGPSGVLPFKVAAGTTIPAATAALTVTKFGTGSGSVASTIPGIHCGATCSASYAPGTVVTLSASADAGSYFAGWSAPCSGNGICTVTLTVDTRITAAFSPPGYGDVVQRLYIGYYQRPADPGGLAFWKNGLAQFDTNHDGNFVGENIIPALEQFAYSDEARTLYGGDITGSNIATVIDSIYQGLFGRSPEDEGKAFWVNSFNTGASTPATILWELMKGAQGTDAQTVQNRLVAASRFTHVVDPDLDGLPPFDRRYAGYADCVTARQWLSHVTSDPATMPTEDEIRALLPMP
jgi:hypothetical protein